VDIIVDIMIHTVTVCMLIDTVVLTFWHRSFTFKF